MLLLSSDGVLEIGEVYLPSAMVLSHMNFRSLRYLPVFHCVVVHGHGHGYGYGYGYGRES